MKLDSFHPLSTRVDQQRAVSPVPSSVSISSEQSHDGLLDFKDGRHSTDQRFEVD